jgi:hypothetical protein
MRLEPGYTRIHNGQLVDDLDDVARDVDTE